MSRDFKEDGVWLSKIDATAACGMTTYEFTKKILGSLQKRKVSKGRVQFFVPFSKMTKEAREIHEDLVQADDVDLIEENDEAMTGVEAELNEARLSNIKARTALLEQKLEEEKQSVWFEWNGLVFSEFSEAFAKVKNTLISLHLNEEQLKTLNDGIDDALKSLKDRLDAMWAKFKNGDDEENKEEKEQ